MGKHGGVAAAGQKRPRKARDYFVPRRRPARALWRRGGRRKRRKRRWRGTARAKTRGGSGPAGAAKEGKAFRSFLRARRVVPHRRHAKPRRATSRAEPRCPRLDRPRRRRLGRETRPGGTAKAVSRRVRVACACSRAANSRACRRRCATCEVTERIRDGGGGETLRTATRDEAH